MKYFILIIFSVFNSNFINSLDIAPNDNAFEYKFGIPGNTYHKYCKNVYSQNGEDGILEQIFKELKIKNGTFCEFGASNGIDSSNTLNLIKNYNFSGILIESDTKLYKECIENYKIFPNVTIFNGSVIYNDKNNDLDAWLKKSNLSKDLDLLSIDIDCDDYYVWKNLDQFNPKVVIIETNSYRDPIFYELPKVPSNEYNIDVLKNWCPSRIGVGCSFISAVHLGLKKGYIPVAYTGNITFIRKDLVNQLKEFPYIISNDPFDYINLYTHLALWKDKWVTNTGLILNVAIRDYYIKFRKKYIDINWINKRMHSIFYNDNSFIRE